MFDIDYKKVYLSALRQFCYFAGIFAFVFCIHYLADRFKAETFAEFGVVENMQLGILVISGFIFTIQAIAYKDYRELLFLLASVCFLASCRELDSWFDKRIPLISWRVGFVFPFVALLLAFINRKNIMKQLIPFFGSPAFYMMVSVLILVLPIAQCIGHRSFVEDILGANNVREIKEFIEETVECLGYMLLLFSTFEIYCNLLKHQHS